MKLSLNERQLRVLARIARQMATRASCDISLQLREGGVRDYDEARKFSPADFDSPGEDFTRQVIALLES